MPRSPSESPRPARVAALVSAALVASSLAGCTSPERGRPRGGGPGGDGGNYVPGRIHPPSKIDGTRTWDDRPRI